MELHELQKMISIIHDKKPKCRGNLRVKVLLKSTHDYVRRSLIDDQLGNPESLMTLLRNSGTVKETTSPAHTSLETDLHSMNNQICDTVQADSDAMDCDEVPSQHTTADVDDQVLQSEGSSNQSMKHLLDNISATNKAFPKTEDNYNLNNVPTQVPVSELPECGDAFKNSNKNFGRNNDKNTKEKYFKLTKALRKVMKHWDQLMSNAKRDTSYLKRHYHSVKKMRKLLLESKVCFKADFENQSFSQQQLIQIYLKVIKKMLKQCDNVLENK